MRAIALGALGTLGALVAMRALAFAAPLAVAVPDTSLTRAHFAGQCVDVGGYWMFSVSSLLRHVLHVQSGQR